MNELVDADQPDDELVARSRNRTFLAEMGYLSSDEKSAPSVSDEASVDTKETIEPMTIEVMPEDTDTNIVPPAIGKKEPHKRKMLWQWILLAILALVVCAAIVMLFLPSSPEDNNNKQTNKSRIEYVPGGNRSRQAESTDGTIYRGGVSDEEEDEFVEDDIDIKVSKTAKSPKTKSNKAKTDNQTTKKIREVITNSQNTKTDTEDAEKRNDQGQSGESAGSQSNSSQSGKVTEKMKEQIINKVNTGSKSGSQENNSESQNVTQEG